jgi:enoyl-CoA hydratase/carnithine racemase
MAAKQTVYLALQQGLGEALDQADRLWEPVYLSADVQEGLAAFRAKRPPVWTGR